MKISYRFTFEDGTRKVFAVDLHAESLNVISPDDQAKPEWTKLANHRCQDCQLEENVVQDLVQNSPDIIYRLDHEGNFSLVDGAVEKLLGFS